MDPARAIVLESTHVLTWAPWGGNGKKGAGKKHRWRRPIGGGRLSARQGEGGAVERARPQGGLAERERKERGSGPGKRFGREHFSDFEVLIITEIEIRKIGF